MIIFLECASITDNVDFISKIDKSRLNPMEASEVQNISNIRSDLKNYSDIEYLLGRIKSGENLITKKIIFDKYLKSGVDIMKLLVRLGISCPFKYLSIYGENPIDASNMSVKQQWAVEMIMSRYTISSIYHLGAYSSLMSIHQMTKDSYSPKFKDQVIFHKDLQVAISYFKEAYQPIVRFSSVFNWVEKLLTLASQQYIEIKKEIFEVHKSLVQCNLGYLLIEKLRFNHIEYRKCKQGAKDIYQKFYRVRQTLGGFPQVKSTILQFVETGLLFYKIVTLLYLIKQNEIRKVDEDLGYVKKEFKVMIVQNLMAAKMIIALSKELIAKNYGTEFYEFAKELCEEVFMKFAAECQSVFSIKTQSAGDIYKEAEARPFEHVWEMIPSYNLMNDIL